MFQKILTPVDLGHIGKCGEMLQRAKALVENGQGEIILLNVIPELPAYVSAELPAGLHEKAMSGARTEMQKLVKDHGLPKSTKMTVVHGKPSREILSVAEREKVDLIIVASHQPDFSDYLLGSVAGRVVRHAHCSVLVLR